MSTPTQRLSSPSSSLLILLLFSTLSIAVVSSAKARCNPQDRKVLFQIKQSLGNPYLLASWKEDLDCCSWYCVECDRTTHRIIELTVFAGELSGQLPDTIDDLPYLQTLTFRKLTNLTGTIPRGILKLKQLKYLRLDWNKLSGPVPDFLGQMDSLFSIDLSFNSFSGSIPASLAYLPNLGDLHLGRNNLTGPIPESFGSFKQDNFYLRLSHNQLSGLIPKSLGKGNFTLIDFSRNMLSGDASFLFGKNRMLQTIDLSRNHKLSFDISNVEFDDDLNTIDLNHNFIYGTLPMGLAKLPMLQMFNVSYNRLCGAIPIGGEMERFDAFSYAHNKCLCGTPLPACK